MRTERLVALRSTLPVNLMTLRHSVPELWEDGVEQPELPEPPVSGNPTTTASATASTTGSTTGTTTPKVDPNRKVETTAGKGGDAR